jgi:hypothetical protein
MIIETLAIKGLVWIAHNLSAAALTHLAGYAVSHGIIATATAILTSPIVIGSSILIGSVLWTSETANKVNRIIKYLADGNTEYVAKILLEMYIKDKIGSTLDDTVGEIGSLLLKNYSADTVASITGELRTIVSEIDKYK